MPFLFVDYDQGVGGERFCAALSQAPQCESLQYITYPNGRTKVLDCFEQQFLVASPVIKAKLSHPLLYTVVPTHRHSDLAREKLQDVRTIRLAYPQNSDLRNFVVQQRIDKVLLSTEPTQEYFLGYLKILKQSAVNPDFLRHVKFGMKNIELLLLSQGIEPTTDNMNYYIESCYRFFTVEPDFEYDLVIEYDQLIWHKNLVVEQINQCFGIDLDASLLNFHAPENYSAT